MTRAETQAKTRTQLVKTARQQFFEDGYHPTSLEKVADAAGYSKGAVYSNFRNKDELCTAVLDEVRVERSRRGPRDHGDAGHAIADRGATRLGGTRHRRSGMDVTGSRVRRARSPQRVTAHRAGRAVWTISSKCSLPLWNPRTIPDLKMPGRDTATVMLALGIGLGLLRSIDPPYRSTDSSTPCGS